MNLAAGSIRLIPLDKVVSLQLSTHSISLSYLIQYLTPYCQEIILIGIQPLSTRIGESLSEPVLKACYLLIDLLKKNQLKNIPTLN
jgi:hydrogenase 3 maturation protease